MYIRPLILIHIQINSVIGKHRNVIEVTNFMIYENFEKRQLMSKQ